MDIQAIASVTTAICAIMALPISIWAIVVSKKMEHRVKNQGGPTMIGCSASGNGRDGFNSSQQ